jgi:hypothetical protein
MFTIEDAKHVQRDLRLGHTHVAFIDPNEGFVLAHTDAERASGASSLWRCPIHDWLRDGDPYWDVAPGWYQIPSLRSFSPPSGRMKGLAL